MFSKHFFHDVDDMFDYVVLIRASFSCTSFFFLLRWEIEIERLVGIYVWIFFDQEVALKLKRLPAVTL